jgi:hypothetical protein
MKRLLSSQIFPILAAALSMVLTLPSLGSGWMVDDHFHRVVMLGSEQFSEDLPGPLDMFRFLTGDRETNLRRMDEGILPWWTDPTIHGAFWRPVTAITHWLDYRLWPASPAIMHLHSVLWWGGTVLLAGLFFRRIMGPTWVAGLAMLLYAIDDARGLPVGFLANRNAIIATFFGLLTLILHDRWRREGRVAMMPPALGAFALSLLSSEGGLATTAYLFSFALLIDRGRLRARLLSLAPYALIVVVWRIIWRAGGYGVSAGMGFYIDPLTEPLAFLAALPVRIPALLLGLFGAPPADIHLFLGETGFVIHSVVAVVVLLIAAVIAYPYLRGGRDTGFWGLALLLSLLPISATIPSDRLLMFAGLGGMALVARFLEGYFRYTSSSSRKRDDVPGSQEQAASVTGGQRGLRLMAAKVLVVALVVLHLIFAPVALAIRSAYPSGPPALVEQLLIQVPFDPSIEEKTLIVVNAPLVFFNAYLPIIRGLDGQPVPHRVRHLASGIPAMKVTRHDERTLSVRPEWGFIRGFFDQLFRSSRRPLRIGDRIELGGMTVLIANLTPDGRPAEARFTFDWPLEDPRLEWLYWVDGEFRKWTPPQIGETVELVCDWPLSTLRKVR